MNPNRYLAILKYAFNSKAYKKAGYKKSYAYRIAQGKTSFDTSTYILNIAQKDVRIYNLLMEYGDYSTPYADRNWKAFHMGKAPFIEATLRKKTSISSKLLSNKPIPIPEAIAEERPRVAKEKIGQKVQSIISKHKVTVEPTQAIYYGDNTKRLLIKVVGESLDKIYSSLLDVTKKQAIEECYKLFYLLKDTIRYLRWERWFIGAIITYEVWEYDEATGGYKYAYSDVFSTPFQGNQIANKNEFALDLLGMIENYNTDLEYKSEKTGNLYVLTGIYLCIHGRRKQ